MFFSCENLTPAIASSASVTLIEYSAMFPFVHEPEVLVKGLQELFSQYGFCTEAGLSTLLVRSETGFKGQPR